MKFPKRPVRISPLLLPIYLPLLFVAAAISIPYWKIRRRRMARRENRFKESMRISGRVMDWADFVCELDRGNGMLIVERFSFEGPIRLWWTRDDLYKTCPYPLVDWLTMTRDTTFDPMRDWFRTKHTGSTTGEAMLVAATNDQWRTILAEDTKTWPTFRDGIRFVEVPPPRNSSC